MKNWKEWQPFIVAVILFAAGTLVARELLAPLINQTRVRQMSSAARRFYLVEGRVNRTGRALKRLLAADMIDAAVPANGTFFISTQPVDSMYARHVRELAARDLRSSKATVGLVSYSDRIGEKYGLPVVGVRTSYFDGIKNGHDYCVVGAPYWGDANKPHFFTRWSPHNINDFLGVCHYWAAYGRPGKLVHEWLRAGSGIRSYYGNDGFVPAETRQAHGLFGSRQRWLPIETQACTAGRIQYCEAIFLHQVKQREAASDIDYGEWVFPSQNQLLGEFEKQFGKERFERFWTSDADVKTAFASAFGIGLDQWLGEWVKRFHAPKPGPGVGGSSIFITLLTLAAFAGISLYIAQRRSV